MGKPRLLVVGPLPPPVGGVETVTKAILESSSLAEFELEHCDLTKGRPKSTQGKFDLGNFHWAWIHFGRMRRSLRRFKPDVVYLPVTCTWSGFLRDAVLAKLAKRSGAMLVGHVHGGWFDLLISNRGIRLRIVRSTLELFDSMLMLGQKWKRSIEGFGYRGRVRVVPSTLRDEALSAAAEAPRNYERPFTNGLYVGHIGKNKGVIDMLRAQAALLGTGMSLKIRYVGPGQFAGDMAQALAMRDELGLQAIAEFVDEKRGGELYQEFSGADFLALPSHFEGLPVVFFEAGAFGMPVIGTPVGAVTEFLKDGQNSLIVPVGDVDELARAMTSLAVNPALRKTLGLALKEDTRAYHPEKVCAQIADAIREVLA